MARLTFYSSIFLFATQGLAVWDSYHFTTEASDWQCKDLPYGCAPPRACARDSVLDKEYCCGIGEGAVCFQGSSECNNGTDGKLQSTLQPCSGGVNAFCCLSNTERCTQTFNQINICWNSNPTPFGDVTEAHMNETFSSISSASPADATALSIDFQRLTASSSSSASSATSSATTTPASSSASTTTSSPTSSPTSTGASISISLSGGEIGGIVAGVVVVLLLIALGVFFWRKRSKKNGTGNKSELDSNPYVNGPNGQYNAVATGDYQQEKYAHRQPGAVEAPNTHAPIELMSQDTPRAPVELDSGYSAHPR